MGRPGLGLGWATAKADRLQNTVVNRIYQYNKKYMESTHAAIVSRMAGEMAGLYGKWQSGIAEGRWVMLARADASVTSVRIVGVH
jgi:hypothetical protein